MITNMTIQITAKKMQLSQSFTDYAEERISAKLDKFFGDDAKAKLTLKKLTYEITKYIGAYAAAMNGVDLIVFTGGIGENNSRLRRRVCENLTYLGVKFDYDANVARGEDTMLTLPDSKVKVALITTNEELMIARDTMNIVQNEE